MFLRNPFSDTSLLSENISLYRMFSSDYSDRFERKNKTFE
jgi:hypothetical protein